MCLVDGRQVVWERERSLGGVVGVAGVGCAVGCARRLWHVVRACVIEVSALVRSVIGACARCSVVRVAPWFVL